MAMMFSGLAPRGQAVRFSLRRHSKPNVTRFYAAKPASRVTFHFSAVDSPL